MRKATDLELNVHPRWLGYVERGLRFMNIVKSTFSIACLLLASTVAQAHLVTFGWKDHGNGTVTLWGEHWHGNQSGPSTANGGIHISQGGIPLFTAQWTGFLNNSDRDDMLTSGVLTGWDDNTGNAGSGANDDWFFTDPLVIGNGTWDFFTGTNCCIDTMLTPVQITLTGITSVPPGTGPGAPGAVPIPAAALLFAPALLGFFGLRRKANKVA